MLTTASEGVCQARRPLRWAVQPGTVVGTATATARGAPLLCARPWPGQCGGGCPGGQVQPGPPCGARPPPPPVLCNNPPPAAPRHSGDADQAPDGVGEPFWPVDGQCHTGHAGDDGGVAEDADVVRH